jgi:hypothetical protein
MRFSNKLTHATSPSIARQFAAVKQGSDSPRGATHLIVTVMMAQDKITKEVGPRGNELSDGRLAGCCDNSR